MRPVLAFRRQPGFALVSAIFLLVALVSLGAFLVSILTTQNVTSAQDIQGSRAYHAARAGLDWGLYQVLDPTNATAPNMPICPAGGACTLDATVGGTCSSLAIEGFAVEVACQRFPGATTTDNFNEAGTNRQIAVFRLVATAQTGTVGTPGFVERQLVLDVSKCRVQDSTPPGQECP